VRHHTGKSPLSSVSMETPLGKTPTTHKPRNGWMNAISSSNCQCVKEKVNQMVLPYIALRIILLEIRVKSEQRNGKSKRPVGRL